MVPESISYHHLKVFSVGISRIKKYNFYTSIHVTFLLQNTINTDRDFEEERALILGDHQRKRDRVSRFFESIHACSWSFVHG